MFNDEPNPAEKYFLAVINGSSNLDELETAAMDYSKQQKRNNETPVTISYFHYLSQRRYEAEHNIRNCVFTPPMQQQVIKGCYEASLKYVKQHFSEFITATEEDDRVIDNLLTCSSL